MQTRLRFSILTGAALLASIVAAGCGSGTPTKSAAELTPDLKHAEERVRLAAVEQLGQVGSGQAPEAVRALTEALADTSAYVRHAAVRGLARHGSAARDAVPTLQKALKDSDEGVRLDAAEALKKIQGS